MFLEIMGFTEPFKAQRAAVGLLSSVGAEMFL
jgi:hypothetical protein